MLERVIQKYIQVLKCSFYFSFLINILCYQGYYLRIVQDSLRGTTAFNK